MMKYEDFKNEILNQLNERKKFHLNDDFKTYKYWESISDKFANNERQAIKLLNESDEETINWFSEFFEELCLKFKTEDIRQTLKLLTIKYPNLELERCYD